MRAVRRLHLNRASTAAVVIGIILVLAGVFKVYQTAANAHKAICALRSDRIQSIKTQETFLKKHPNGLQFKDADGKTVKVTRADLLRTIQQQKITVRAFRFADC